MEKGMDQKREKALDPLLITENTERRLEHHGEYL